MLIPRHRRRARLHLLLLLPLLFGLYADASAQDGDLVGTTGGKAKNPNPVRGGSGHGGKGHNTRKQTAAVKVNPAVDGAIQLGDAALDSNPPRYNDAVTAYTLATNIDARDARGFIGLGDVYFEQKNYTQAETYYQRGFALADKESKPYAELGKVIAARKRYAEAAPLLQKALAVEPLEAADAPLLVLFGEVSLKLGQLDAAAAHYMRAASLNPKLAEARSGLALVYYTKGDGAKARLSWEEAAKLDPASSLARGALFLLDGRYAEALAQLVQYTKSFPDDEDGWLLLGDARRAGGDAAGASTNYARAASTAPDYAKLPRPTLTTPTGALSISGVAGATISIASAAGGEAQQMTVPTGQALSLSPLHPGRYHVSSRLEGYEPAEKEVEVVAGGNANVSLDMRRLPSTKALFASWTDATGWAVPSGWGVGTHSLSVGGEGVAFPTQTAFLNYGDFLLSSDVRMLNGQAISFAVRAADERNYFLIQLTGSQSSEPNLLRGFTVINNVRNPYGTSIPIAPAIATAFDVNKFFTIQIYLKENTALVTLVNSETGEATALGRLSLPAEGYKSGAVGIAAGASEKNEVGRFAIYTGEDMGAMNWLRGTIRGNGGTPIAGALVQLTDKVSGAVVARRTNAEGGFTHDWLPPGNYSIRVSAQGFRMKEFEQIVSTEASTLDPIGLDSAETVAPTPVTRAGNPVTTAESRPNAVTAGTASNDPKPRHVTNVREAEPDTVQHVTLGTMASSRGTISITAPAGTRILVEPLLGKEGRLFTMPTGRQTVYLNQMNMGNYRITAILNGLTIMDQETFVPAGRILQVTIRSPRSQ
jgi:tetratricopeptide (TPR) repeat protein